MSQISLYSCTVLNSYLALGKGSRPPEKMLAFLCSGPTPDVYLSMLNSPSELLGNLVQ